MSFGESRGGPEGGCTARARLAALLRLPRCARPVQPADSPLQGRVALYSLSHGRWSLVCIYLCARAWHGQASVVPRQRRIEVAESMTEAYEEMPQPAEPRQESRYRPERGRCRARGRRRCAWPAWFGYTRVAEHAAPGADQRTHSSHQGPRGAGTQVAERRDPAREARRGARCCRQVPRGDRAVQRRTQDRPQAHRGLSRSGHGGDARRSGRQGQALLQEGPGAHRRRPSSRRSTSAGRMRCTTWA